MARGLCNAAGMLLFEALYKTTLLKPLTRARVTRPATVTRVLIDRVGYLGF